MVLIVVIGAVITIVLPLWCLCKATGDFNRNFEKKSDRYDRKEYKETLRD